MDRSNGDMVKLASQLAGLGVLSIERLAYILQTSQDEQAQLRAIENVLDRIGLGRQSKAEVRQVVSLDPETVELLRGAEAVLRAAEARLGSQLLLPDSSDDTDS